MNKKSKHKIIYIIVPILIFLGLMAAYFLRTGQEDKPQENLDGTEVSNTGSPTGKPEDGNSGSQQKLYFSSGNNFRSYFTVEIELPEGVKASDITQLKFSVDTESDLSLRLYAGDDTFAKDTDLELTHMDKKIDPVAEGTETIQVDGKEIEKKVYRLNDEIVEDTRISVESGTGAEVSYQVDDHAKEILSKIEGKSLTLGIYSHNTEPAFVLYDLQITTSQGDHKIILTEENTSGRDGGQVKIK